MADTAFKSAAYPAYTIAQLEEFVAAGRGNPKMIDEIARRRAVAAGDMSRATDGERLRASRERAAAALRAASTTY